MGVEDTLTNIGEIYFDAGEVEQALKAYQKVVTNYKDAETYGYALYKLGSDPFWFVLLSGFVFFAWGEIYSLFPSTCTDTFGAKFAATNAGLLYTAKGTAALLTPYSNMLQQTTKSWDLVFIIAAGANILAALLALFVLKPWRAKIIAAGK